MKYDWTDDFLLSKKGVTKDFQADWNWIRYKVDDKMFVAICLNSENNPKYITLKLNPVDGDFISFDNASDEFNEYFESLYANSPLV